MSKLHLFHKNKESTCTVSSIIMVSTLTATCTNHTVFVAADGYWLITETNKVDHDHSNSAFCYSDWREKSEDEL